MKVIQEKTKSMLHVQEKNNLPIEELLRIKYVDEHLQLHVIAQQIGITYPTLLSWLKQAGIYGRKINMGDGE